MIIQHNIMSLNAHRQMGGNTNQVSKNLEKLSSGYKINRAGDDAAGLAISEKMRAQITGLTRAQSNAQDGISLVQTAEGALTEVHSMLNRMVDLATQSSNGTMQGDDRQKISDEMKALTEEIDRISQSTNFNGIKLLDGSLGGGGNTTANIKWAGATPTVSQAAAVKQSYAAGTATVNANNTGITVEYTDSTGAAKKATITGVTAGADAKATAAAIVAELNKDADFKATFKASSDATGKLSFEAIANGKTKATITKVETSGGTAVTTGLLGTATAGADARSTYNLSGTLATGDQVQVGGKTYTYKALADGSDGSTFKDFAALQAATLLNGITTGGTAAAATFTAADGSGLTLQIGDTADAFNKVTVSVANMGTAGLGIDAIQVGEQGVASDAIKTIKDAIETVSVNRSAMGALQNRLEHTINNLGVTTENMTAAESRIRDVDMAKEMAAFTKNNVLTQAAQAMLAQANQQPQQVLQLLR